MTVSAKATATVHMIERTSELACDHCGTVLGARGPETLLCGEAIVGASFDDAGYAAEMGTRLTSNPKYVTCKACLKEAS